MIFRMYTIAHGSSAQVPHHLKTGGSRKADKVYHKADREPDHQICVLAAAIAAPRSTRGASRCN
eukprot:491542-Amphidinium_carterae.1